MNNKPFLGELNLKNGIMNICCFYSLSTLLIFGEISSPHSHGLAGCPVGVLHSKAPDPGCVNQGSSPSDNKNWSKWAPRPPWATQRHSLDFWEGLGKSWEKLGKSSPSPLGWENGTRIDIGL